MSTPQTPLSLSDPRLLAFEKQPAPITATAFNKTGQIFAYAIAYDWSKVCTRPRRYSEKTLLLRTNRVILGCKPATPTKSCCMPVRMKRSNGSPENNRVPPRCDDFPWSYHDATATTHITYCSCNTTLRCNIFLHPSRLNIVVFETTPS
jgi:hypothetical protein